MRKSIRLFVLLVISQFYVTLVQASCSSDKALQEAQFELHSSSDFKVLSNYVLDVFTATRRNFVYDTSGPMRGHDDQNINLTLHMISYDDVTTPKSTQFGDIVFVFAEKPSNNLILSNMVKASDKPLTETPEFRQLVELRWWVDDTRHVVYNKDKINCAINTIPMAENTLF